MEQKNFTIIDKNQAKTLGLTRYFTGKPCKFNHFDERMVSTRSCVSCKNNKEKFRSPRIFTLEQKNIFAQKSKKYREQNPEKSREISLKNYHNHKQKRNKQTAKYIASRRKNDVLYAFKVRIKSLINQSFRVKFLTKTSKTIQIVGCSFDDLMTHIEKQFTNCMNWENRDQWHIDHIVPLATAKNEKDVIALNHFSNLRPLWAKENLQKGSKLNFLI